MAVCSIGESTKSASDPGYIGHKGIGFKSVFKGEHKWRKLRKGLLYNSY